MIRINLLRDVEASASKPEATFLTSIGEGARLGATPEMQQLVVKLGATVVTMVLFIGYATYVESERADVIKQIETEIAKKTQEKASLASAIRAVEDFKKEKERLQVQIDTIKALSKARLRNVKALEALQNLFPEKAWLTSMKIEESKTDSKGNVSESKVMYEGFAVDDKVVADLMSALEENIYFSNVRLIRTEEQKSKNGTIKSFRIESFMEGI